MTILFVMKELRNLETWEKLFKRYEMFGFVILSKKLVVAMSKMDPLLILVSVIIIF